MRLLSKGRGLGTYPVWPTCRRIEDALDHLRHVIEQERHWADEPDRAALNEALELLAPVREAVQRASDEIDRQCEVHLAAEDAAQPEHVP